MDELVIGDKTYISSKRAAAITGYAKDYIGQLCREGRVEAKLVGRSWYVYEPSLKKHRFKDELETLDENETFDALETEIPVIQEESPRAPEPSEKTNEQAPSWEAPRYEVEETSLLPDMVSKEEDQVDSVESPVPQEPKKTSEVQTAWEEWFQKEPKQVEMKEAEETPVRVVETPASYREDRQPAYNKHVFHDMRPAGSVLVSDVIVASPISNRPTKVRRKRRKAGSAVISALLVAIMLISASLAIVVSGGMEKFGRVGPLNDFLSFLGGASVVEK